MAAWVRTRDIEIISFSPERFFQIIGQGCHPRIIAEPIKGTSPVLTDTEANEKSKQFLRDSLKDRAELHMIVDLMRNDLNRVAKPFSVTVKDSGSLQSFTNVHHLIARVAADVKVGLTLGDVLEALAPGGSITGAPKKEVMAAIREYEGHF